MMYLRRTLFAVGFWLLLFPLNVKALPPNDAELLLSRQIADLFAEFDTASKSPVSKVETINAPVVEVLANYNPVRINYAHGGKIRIGEVVYQQGLFCHAPSDLLVRLPKPAKTFRAKIGVDNNLTFGNGTVVFRVTGQGIHYESPVLHGGEKAVDLQVDLAGQKEFHLQVSETADGISHDQSNWAEAEVELVDGARLPLDGLPILEKSETKIPPQLPFSFVYDGKSSRDFL